mmetsp:Transcript_23301/g.48227  ORF Transcript_23301/g.48227 Transcript_23301/m.48227 type:complete len:424 (+) Transcript_23301:96-1367(+)
MMDPASSSSSDDGSASSSSAIDGQPIRIKRVAHNKAGGEDSNESSDEGSVEGSESNEDSDEYGRRKVTNFDDLPTDDSEEENYSNDDGSSIDADGDVIDSGRKKIHDSGSDDESSDEDEAANEDLSLGYMVASREKLGRRYYSDDSKKQRDNSSYGADGGKQSRAERKCRAIELAMERLKKVKAGKNKDGELPDGDSSNEHSSNKLDSDGKITDSKPQKSKHAPTEMSSKRRDHFARVKKSDLNSSGIGISIGANKYKPRDPRMVSLSGHLDADTFEKRYAFLDDVQEKEIEKLKHRIKAWKTTGKKGQKERKKLGLTQGGGSSEFDQEELTRLLQERAERQKAQVTRAAKRSVKKKIRDEVAAGKRGAYYPKRSELRRMEVEAKFEEIRKRGGDDAVNKAIAKRRKKNVAKSHKLMPSHMTS